MRADLIFLGQVLVILVLPVAAWRVLRLRPVMPLVVVQILVGIALGPTSFGRVAPELYRLFFNSATLTPLCVGGRVRGCLRLGKNYTDDRPTGRPGSRRGRAQRTIRPASVAVRMGLRPKSSIIRRFIIRGKAGSVVRWHCHLEAKGRLECLGRTSPFRSERAKVWNR
jgi:hypothetical protein